MPTLTDSQEFEHCECGHDRVRHNKGRAYGLDCFYCTICGCPEFNSAEPNRPQPDLHQLCRCQCERGQHTGWQHGGRCACGCRRFLARMDDVVEAELRAYSRTVDSLFNAMRKA